MVVFRWFLNGSIYGIRIGGMVELRAGIRSTETLMAKTSESAELGRAGWMDGQIVLGVNL